MGYSNCFISVVLSFVATAIAQSTFSPARPPSLPLAVRSPYLSTWQPAGSDGGNGGYLAGQWPSFWAGAITGWTGLIRVDGTVYTWLGNPAPLPTVVNQTAFSYTSTRSIFSMDAGPVSMNITFLSPVTPNDLLRQSMPITYMSVEVQSTDGNEHDVQLYTDVSAEWTSGDRTQTAQWEYGVTNSSSSTKKRNADADSDWHSRGGEGWPGEGWPGQGWRGEGRGGDGWHGGEAGRRHRPNHRVNSRTSSSILTSLSAAASASGTTAASATSQSSSVADAASTSGSSSAAASTASGSVSAVSVAASSTLSASSGSGASSTSGTSTNTTAAAGASSTSNSTSSTASNSTTSSTTSATTATGTASAGGIAYHKFWRQLQQEFSEEDQQASWGYWYYATENVVGLTYASGSDVDVRGAFTSSGVLNNTQDTNFRAIDDDYPVFGFAVDLGSVGSDSVESVFTINLAQSDAIQFNGANGVESLASYWTSSYPDYEDALAFFYNDYSNVAGLCTTLDNQIVTDSTAAGGADYVTLTSLVVRQAFNALTVVSDGTDQYIFLKEISSDGDIQTVDVIFPAIPIILYLAPSWMKLLLDPIYIYTEAGHFTQGSYALHDLGFFPNATSAGTEMQPLEECGNMLIMTLAYAQKTGDTQYLSDHYDTLNQWTSYLVNDSLIPANQISTDDFAGSLANQTNLALKGMIGIQAMSLIANLTGHQADGSNFSQIAANYITQWQGFGIAQNATPPHTTLNYNNYSSHGLLYNLYADSLLQTNLVPTSVYQMQSDFYPTVANTYGVPLDTRHNYSKNDWEMFCAAIAASNTTSMFISDIAKLINETPTNGPMTDLYDTSSGDFAIGVTHFIDRPVVGGWFSLLALNQTGIPSR